MECLSKINLLLPFGYSKTVFQRPFNLAFFNLSSSEIWVPFILDFLNVDTIQIFILKLYSLKYQKVSAL